MKKLLLSIITLLTISSTNIKASEGVYAQALGGAGWINSKTICTKKTKFDTGYLVGGSVGYEFCNGLRIEGEYTYRHNKEKSQKNIAFTKDIKIEKPSFLRKGHSRISTHAEMANVIWNAPVLSGLKTYIGAGIGYAQTKTSFGHEMSADDKTSYGVNFDKRQKCSGFAWQTIAGVAYPISDRVSVGVEYRFFQAKKKNNNNNVVFAAMLTL